MMIWTDEQIDTWCLAWQAYREEKAAIDQAMEHHTQQRRVRQDILTHLTAFVEGQNTLPEFNALLQQKIHSDWNLFGLRGASGGLFLNKLVKYIPHADQLTHHLRMALPVPQDVREGQHRMQALALFLDGILTAGQISRAQLQPAHLPYFLSVWWHIQEEEDWPRFSGQLRRLILNGLPLADPLESQVDLYFAFRERFLVLKTSFGISAWELEHFLQWQENKEQAEDAQQKTKERASSAQMARSGQLPARQARRWYMQWLLAKIGAKVGCQVWIARQDQEKYWNGECLGQFSLSALPSSVCTAFPSHTHLEQTALLWLRKNEIVAAYEIDPKRTEIATSLLHLYDLGWAAVKRPIHLCLVLPKDLCAPAIAELSRPSLRQQQGRQRCFFIREEDLAANAEHILRWASSPEVIKQLACSCEEEKESA